MATKAKKTKDLDALLSEATAELEAAEAVLEKDADNVDAWHNVDNCRARIRELRDRLTARAETRRNIAARHEAHNAERMRKAAREAQMAAADRIVASRAPMLEAVNKLLGCITQVGAVLDDIERLTAAARSDVSAVTTDSGKQAQLARYTGPTSLIGPIADALARAGLGHKAINLAPYVIVNRPLTLQPGKMPSADELFERDTARILGSLNVALNPPAKNSEGAGVPWYGRRDDEPRHDSFNELMKRGELKFDDGGQVERHAKRVADAAKGFTRDAEGKVKSIGAELAE